jgi:hypothetical protein
MARQYYVGEVGVDGGRSLRQSMGRKLDQDGSSDDVMEISLTCSMISSGQDKCL